MNYNAAALSNQSGFKSVKIAPKPLTNAEKGGIIKESSKKGVTSITDSAIEKVPKLSLKGYTDEQNTFIRQQHKELLRFAHDEKESREVAFVFRKDFSEKTVFKGDEEHVSFGAALQGKGNNLFVMHNHPKNSGYSDTDIIFFISDERVQTLTLVKNNGSVEVITKSEKFDRLKATNTFKRIYKKTVKTGTEHEKDMAVKKFLEKGYGGFGWMKKE